ncbi:Uncharacterized conserved protein, DUF885 familyt [Tardiphaga sp. OK246]|uniref:DUF885 domain-containing protein n=1 Tax=Tardiphaga sp. OK246 TaxID=1855307 RepID=UPI000B6FF2B6|nr:DUF885 family protein [Tardiphaga sp. OK246]SNS46192.1 Uncharacterized conserved protein, DUF885 familyt [Tardiphaga sp. OK246]
MPQRDAGMGMFKDGRITRRDALGGIALLAATFPDPVACAAKMHSTEDQRLRHLLNVIAEERLQRLPELVTALGLDRTARWTGIKSKLNERSVAASEQDRRCIQNWRAQLGKIDRNALTGQDAINHDVIMTWLVTEDEVNREFGAVTGRPYAITHMEGAYLSVPELLSSKHQLVDQDDVEAYLNRLEIFAIALDQDSARLRHDCEHGLLPLDFVIEATIGQLDLLARTPISMSFAVAPFSGRTTADVHLRKMTMIWDNAIVPALNRQIALLSSLRSHARHDAGLWSVKGGSQLYAALLRLATSTERSSDELHAFAIDTVRETRDRLEQALREQDLTHGTIGERLNHIFGNPSFRYPDSPEGREALMADLEALHSKIQEWVPSRFRTKPRAEALIRAAPWAGPDAYYEDASLDGQRAGICYFALDPAIWPKWRVASALFHESTPGHHLQSTLALQNTDIPLLTRTLWFAGYSEGWALYAEQLVEESGFYRGSPMSRIGYLFASLLRACRLAADTGLHNRRWSRDQVSQYFRTHLGMPDRIAELECGRCCATPGLGSSYMTGKAVILSLRARAQKALGPDFDLRSFHDAVLSSGPLPLTVLDKVIEEFIDSRI